MILSLTVPKVISQMAQGIIHKLAANPGDELRPGTPLLELRIDLGAAKMQDCPPLIFFRLIAIERAVLRSLWVSTGAIVDAGAPIGLATSTASESADGAPTRALRMTSLAIQIDPLSRR